MEQEEVPEILHPLCSQVFLSVWVSLPEFDLHCWQELPDEQRKQNSLAEISLVLIAKRDNNRTKIPAIDSNFFIYPPIKIITSKILIISGLSRRF